MPANFGFTAFKGGFFDREKVLRSLSRAQRTAFSRFGAYVRRRSKTSIKYRKGKSEPGRVPFAHRFAGFTRLKKNRKTGAMSPQQVSPLKELIQFAYDEGRKSVVIGPVQFGSRPGLEQLEYGGKARVKNRGVMKMANFRARPFMRPAFEAERPKFDGLIRDSMK